MTYGWASTIFHSEKGSAVGVEVNITAEKFPKQGSFHRCRVKVCFNYDTSKIVTGTIVRDDMEAPFVMIISLDDGRYVLSTECQYQPEL